MTQLIKRNFEGRLPKHLGMHSQIIHNNSKLRGHHLLDPVNEGDDITHIIQAISPSLCIQFTLNSLAERFFKPRGPEETELFWI